MSSIPPLSIVLPPALVLPATLHDPSTACPAPSARSICTEAGMFAIRARRHTVTEEDFLKAVNKARQGLRTYCLPHVPYTSRCLHYVISAWRMA